MKHTIFATETGVHALILVEQPLVVGGLLFLHLLPERDLLADVTVTVAVLTQE